MKTKTTDVAGKSIKDCLTKGKCSHLKTYTFDINEETYNIKIKKTLIIDQIPHSPPSLMGRVTYDKDKLLKFDFVVETIPGLNGEIIDLVPCFNSSVIRVAQARRAVHLSPNITEAIKTCIKNYYHEFLSTLK